jgi:glycosyltransferase involved in cell wall biosynthesis
MTTRNDPLVSVVIAAFNMGQYLPLAVSSVLNQSYRNFEVIIVDDGSTDTTREAMTKFEDDPKIKLFHQSNQGQASAKNRGIMEASGDFIAFLDADDLWMPNKLERQLPCFDISKDVGVVYTNVSTIDEEGSIISTPNMKYYSGKISGRLLVDNFVTGMASIVRRECFNTVGLFDETFPMGIDYDLWLRISVKYEFFYLDEVTYLYRQWAGQMSHNYKKRLEYAIKIMNSFLERHPKLVDKATVDEAWGHTYVAKGNCIARFEKNKLGALKEYIRALQYKPSYVLAWKGIAKLLIRR